MRCPGEIDGAALDRWITGNYGEDQFAGELDYEEFVDVVCSKCPDYIQKHCPSNTGQNVVCLYILDAIAKTDAENDYDYEGDEDDLSDYAEYQYEGLRESYD